MRTSLGQQDFDPAVREFLDSFYAQPSLRAAALRQEPVVLGPLQDAYLAALAEHLARSFGIEVPEWTDRRGFSLDRPFFAGGLESLKPLLFVESPAAFRRRMIFISKDALSRPRQADWPPQIEGGSGHYDPENQSYP
jgi:hypothetical protein